jgi:hypothetical protein
MGNRFTQKLIGSLVGSREDSCEGDNGMGMGMEMEKVRTPPLRIALGDAGYRVREKVLGGYTFYEILGHNVLIYERGMQDTGLLEPILRFLTGSLVCYRGIAIWHRFWAQARTGRVMPMGDGPPGFVTANSAFIPFADELGEARAAAMAEQGTSNPGEVGHLDQLENFNRGNPDQEIGRIVRVNASAAANHTICFFNAGELQLRGPLPCETEQIFYTRDTPKPQLSLCR